MIRILFTTLVFLLTVSFGFSQNQSLTLEQAFEMAMLENYGIKIAIVDKEIAVLENHPGNAGLMPRVYLQSGVNYSSNNSKQTFFSGEQREANWAGSFGFNTAIQADWTVYDGGAARNRKNILGAYENLSEQQIEVLSRDLLSRIANAFYAVLYYMDAEQLLTQSVAFYEDLERLEQERLRLGRGTRINLLQTQTELNRERARLEQMSSWKKTARMDLFRLMNVEDMEAELIAEDYFEEAELDPDLLAEEIQAENPEIMLELINQQISSMNLDLRQSEKYPTLDLNAGINHAFTQSEVGILQSNRNYGPFVGATLRFNIFDGQRSRRAIQRAELETRISEFRVADLRAALGAELRIRYEEFESAGRVLAIELANEDLARTNLGLAEEMYRAGRISNFELRDIQQQLVRAEESVASLRRVRATSYINLIALTNRFFW
jgi:outer membrane protein